MKEIPFPQAIDGKELQEIIEKERQKWIESLKPKPDDFGMRHLPRDPANPDRFLSVFKTDAHTYTIIGDNGIGFSRYTVFQKRSLQRGFGRSFQQLLDELQKIKLFIGKERDVGKLVSESIINIAAVQDSVADFGKEQFEAALWLCTLFVLREDETISTYSEQIAEEKIADWASYGFSELDFFLLSGSMIPGYGSAYNDTMQRSEKARQRFFDSMEGTVINPLLVDES